MSELFPTHPKFLPTDNNRAAAGQRADILSTNSTMTYGTIFYLDYNTNILNYTNSLIQFNVTNTVPPPGTPNWITTYTNTLAQYITNQIVFDMEDWQTNIAPSEASLDNRLLIG